MTANGCSESAECNIRRYFGGGKVAAAGIRPHGKGGGGGEVAESDSGSKGHWYAGTEKCFAWVGK